MDSPAPPPETPAEAPNEPAFTIVWRDVWGLLVVLGGIGLGMAWQVISGPETEYAGAVSAEAIATGRWHTLVTSMFMHGGLLHLVMNLSALLPFGLILAERMGRTAGGQLRFIGFYLVSGLAAAATWLLMSPGEGAMVGASGAIFGLWGALLRLRRDGGVNPLFSQAVLRQLPGPIIANVIVTVAFAAAGTVTQIATIAWQAHLGGFVFGIATIGLFLPPRQRV